MDWEECYQRDEMPWDLGEPAPPLVELLANRPVSIWGEGSVLVPGCGRGHDAAVLHQHGKEVIGLDLAPSALEAARVMHGEGDGLRWVEGDFLDPALAEEIPVGAIFEHTCFCAIGPELRKAYVEAAARWLEPGGRMVAVFFLDPPRREDGEPGPPYGADRNEIRDLFAGSFTIVREGNPGRAHCEREGREWVVEMYRTCL